MCDEMNLIMKNTYQEEEKVKMIDWLEKEIAQLEKQIHSSLHNGDFNTATHVKGMRDAYNKALNKLQGK